MTRIHTAVSDLWFNYDRSECEMYDEAGMFSGYDDEKLCDEARMFLDCISDLTPDVPTVDELLADYEARV